MENWARGLSKTNALIIGILSLALVAGFYLFFGRFFNGLIPMIVLGAIVGGAAGFSSLFIYKGIIGQTPQERKEARQKK